MHTVFFNWDTVESLISMSHIHTDRHTGKWTYYRCPQNFDIVPNSLSQLKHIECTVLIVNRYCKCKTTYPDPEKLWINIELFFFFPGTFCPRRAWGRPSRATPPSRARTSTCSSWWTSDGRKDRPVMSTLIILVSSKMKTKLRESCNLLSNF